MANKGRSFAIIRNSRRISCIAYLVIPVSWQAVSLTSPTPGTAVSRTRTFGVTGKTSHLGNETIWVTDYDGGYAVDDEATVYDDGEWKASDSNVGDPGRALPFRWTLRVILADAGCAARLQKTMESNGDYLNALPGGCTVAGSVTVKVATHSRSRWRPHSTWHRLAVFPAPRTRSAPMYPAAILTGRAMGRRCRSVGAPPA